MNKKNSNDERGAFEKGQEAEELFMKTAKDLGWDVNVVPEYTDMVEHIDCVMTWGDPMNPSFPAASYGVDVKARNTAEKGEETWVEIRNVNGEAGWLYGKADMIAFDQGDRFLLVERDKLRIFVEENVEREYVTLAHQALMKVYTRKDRKDMITLIKTNDLRAMSTGEMKYA